MERQKEEQPKWEPPDEAEILAAKYWCNPKDRDPFVFDAMRDMKSPEEWYELTGRASEMPRGKVTR